MLFLFVLSSCSKEKNQNFVDQNSYNREKLAKYSDIPVPLGYEFLDIKKNILSQNCDNSDYLCLIGQRDLDKSLKFYLENMEILGWDINNFSNQNEALLVCNKQSRSCVISIRGEQNKSKKTKLCIFVNRNLKTEDNKIRDINFKKLTSVV
ncbi:MAG: hypothetical protein ABIA74_04615 [bacterium]